jgi:molybdopterin molybdotransferase
VVLLSGGVSKGDFDYVPKALEQAGIRRVLHGVSQRPGKPLWFGTSPTGHAVFGLPGNPVSSLICFHRYVLPQLYRSMGAPPPQPAHARLAVDMTPLPQLTLFAPARIQPGSGGLPDALPQTYHGSGDYSSLGESHGFVELERGSPIVHAGTVVRYHGWADTYAESHQP